MSNKKTVQPLAQRLKAMRPAAKLSGMEVYDPKVWRGGEVTPENAGSYNDQILNRGKK